MFEPDEHEDPVAALTTRLRDLGRGWRLRLTQELWIDRDARNGRYVVSTPSSLLARSTRPRREPEAAAREAIERWQELTGRRRMAEVAAGLPFRWHSEHAHSPEGSSRDLSGRHIVLDEPLEQGRLQRAAGDALCRPRRLFWQLDSPLPADEGDIGCRRCREIAGRLGGSGSTEEVDVV